MDVVTTGSKYENPNDKSDLLSNIDNEETNILNGEISRSVLESVVFAFYTNSCLGCRFKSVLKTSRRTAGKLRGVCYCRL